MENPRYVKINNEIIPINTNYKVAIECNQIAQDTSIGDYERALAIIYKLYGDNGLKRVNEYEELLKLGLKYLMVGKDMTEDSNEKIDMDYVEDMDYIKASFMSDYNINLEEQDMHWWTFFNLLNGLSDSEFGNCCILNRIRNIRNMDTKNIKDIKMKEKVEKAKKRFALSKNEKQATDKQKESMNKAYELLGL